MNNEQQLDAIVFIPSFNYGNKIIKLLKELQKQESSFTFKVLVIDSSNDNKTYKLLKEHKKSIILKKIKNSDFAHGPTRNLAAQIAKQYKAKFIVYITQDVIPYNKNWLEEILSPLDKNIEIVCCFGRQVPYKDANPLVKYWINSAFENLRTNKKDLVIHEKGKEDIGKNFNSNVNSAYKTDFIINKVPFKNINYAEDQQIAKDLIENGFKKAYNHKASVYHSHSWDYPFEYFQRFFDEYRGLKESINYLDENLGIKSILKTSLLRSIDDIQNINKQKNISLFSKIKWSFLSLPIELYRHLAIYLGGRHRQISQKTKNYFSREDMQRLNKKSRLTTLETIYANFLIFNTMLNLYIQNKKKAFI